MLLDFKTKLDVNGNGNYLTINTENNEFSRMHSFTADYIVINRSDYKAMLENLKRNGYTETEHTF